MKTVDENRWFDFWVGAFFWFVLITFAIIMMASIFYLGWWLVIGGAVVIVSLCLIYCTGWLIRRIFGVRLHSEDYYRRYGR
jgi:hypothetical protein